MENVWKMLSYHLPRGGYVPSLVLQITHEINNCHNGNCLVKFLYWSYFVPLLNILEPDIHTRCSIHQTAFVHCVNLLSLAGELHGTKCKLHYNQMKVTVCAGMSQYAQCSVIHNMHSSCNVVSTIVYSDREGMISLTFFSTISLEQKEECVLPLSTATLAAQSLMSCDWARPNWNCLTNWRRPPYTWHPLCTFCDELALMLGMFH